MENLNITTVVIVVIIGLALVIFVTVRNQKDKKELNPDAPDAVTEEKTEEMNDRQQS